MYQQQASNDMEDIDNLEFEDEDCDFDYVESSDADALVKVSALVLKWWTEHEHWTKSEFDELESKVNDMIDNVDIETEDLQLEIANQCLDTGIEYTEKLQAFIDKLI